MTVSSSPVLIYPLTGIFGMKMSHAMFSEVFFLYERQVCVAFHLRQRLQSGSVLFCSAIVDFSLAYGSR